jgi:hypothetical protein
MGWNPVQAIIRLWTTYRVVRAAVFAVLILAAIFGVGPMVPHMNWLFATETWIITHTQHPIVLALIVGLMFSTWLIPDVWAFSKQHLIAADQKKLALQERQIVAQEDHTRAIHRQTEQHASDNDPLRQALRQKQADAFFGRQIQNARPDGLEILHESTADYEKAEQSVGRIARICFVLAHNRDVTRSLANCEARLAYSKAEKQFDVPLVQGFTLTPGEKKRIQIVSRQEFSADKFIHVLGIRSGGFFAEAYQHYELPLGETLLTLRITSTESVEAAQTFRTFVDESGKLKLERV